MNQIKLTNWTVAGFWPWTPLFGKSMETGFAMSGVTPSSPAKVPGSVYDDLLRAGLIEDPDIELNSLNCEWVANRWWVYECRFPTPKTSGDQRSVLVFDGIDYEAVIFFNGQQIAEHKGMYTQCRVDITDLLKRKENGEVLVRAGSTFAELISDFQNQGAIKEEDRIRLFSSDGRTEIPDISTVLQDNMYVIVENAATKQLMECVVVLMHEPTAPSADGNVVSDSVVKNTAKASSDSVKVWDENLLLVVIKSAPDEMGQIGYTSRTHTQKARFNYKWDFSTRLVNLGLYGSVSIEQKGAAELAHPAIRVIDARAGKVRLETGVTAQCDTPAQIQVTITDPQGKVAAAATHQLSLTKGGNDFSADFVVEQPQLWWPNGYGDQPLYRVAVEVSDASGSDRYECNLGLRDIAYEQCDDARADSLPYLIRVNGQRVYIKGANMVPLDMLYGCVSDEEYELFVGDIVKKGNLNLLRVWGGGLIETEKFYDVCDRCGILVWQEFIQSSSGIDNVPSKVPEFLELLEKTVYSAVYGRRNHPSLVIWGGGNELMDAAGVPATYEDENIAMIKAITDRLDPDRLFLPTSASGPMEFLDVKSKGANHDVHGPWNYGGVVDHYTMYNLSDSQLHSEFGCNGMASERTIRHICGPAHLGVLDNADYVWRHHGEWWNALPRDIEVVGTPKDMTEMIKIDQFIQAESIRYSVEANNRRAFQNCGSIIWALNEPWPNVANCSMVDHYYDKKLSYKIVGESFASLHPSLRYDSLYLPAGAAFSGEIFLHSDRVEPQAVTLRWSAKEFGGNELAHGEGTFSLSFGDRQSVGTIQFTGTGKPVTVTLQLICGEEIRENRYLFLAHQGESDSVERRADIDAVVNYFDTVDEWALKD